MGLEFKNDVNPTAGEDGVKCPLIESEIKSSCCLENTMVVAGFMDENTIRENFKAKENWKEICQTCKYFKF